VTFSPVTGKNRTIHNATQSEQLAINRFLNQNYLCHRHLDWFTPLEWFEHRPFLLENNQDNIQSLFLAAPEVPHAAWVRLFCIKDPQLLEITWEQMFSTAVSMLKSMEVEKLAALGSSNWFTTLLTGSGFWKLNTIIVLETSNAQVYSSPPRLEINIRPMRIEDLNQVMNVDQAAFEPLWRNALPSLTKAFQGQGISTVASIHDRIVGYQISTFLGLHGHLARLAVHPDHQGKNVATTLVFDLLNRFRGKNIWHVTVNTQLDNMPSLTVYKKFGFQKTGETITVYQINL